MGEFILVSTRNGVEVGRTTALGFNEDELVEVTTFGSSKQEWMPKEGDVTILLTNHMTPVPTPPPRATAPQQVSIGSAADTATFIAETTRKLAEAEHMKQELESLLKITVALLTTMGGVVTLTRDECQAADGTLLDVETIAPDDCLLLRVKDA